MCGTTSLPVILSAMVSFMPISTVRASSAPKDRYAYIVLPYVPCSLWKANGVARLLISLSSMMPSELAASVGSALTGRTSVGQMDAYALMGEGKVFTIAPTGRSYESRRASVERARDLAVDGFAVLVESGFVPLSVSLISGDWFSVIDARLDEHGVLGGCDVGEEARGASRGEQVAHRIALPVVGLGSVERHGDGFFGSPKRLRSRPFSSRI